MEFKKIMLMGSTAGAGKSTVAQYLADSYNFYEITFATPIYDIAQEFFYMKIKDRALLQDVGQKMREIDPYVWVNYAFAEAKMWNDMNVVISDVRQLNEFERGLIEGFLPVRVKCDRDIAVERIRKRDGYCDVGRLDGPAEDGTRELVVPELDNSGTIEQLYLQIDELMRSLGVPKK